jgi:hypothetical protein
LGKESELEMLNINEYASNTNEESDKSNTLMEKKLR